MTGTTPTEPPDEPTGGHVVLGGRYVLGDILGTGGTYTVYEASRLPQADGAANADEGEGGPAGPGEDAPLLVKVLHPHLVDDEQTRASLAREIAASELMDHPSVAKVLDTGEDVVAGASVPWLLARRLPGEPLSEVAGGTGLSWPEALAVAAGLLEALSAVHAAGLVHRDVGPRNVVVDRHDDGTMTVGLLDLGLTAPGGGEGDGQRVAGSAAYMSPEQAQGKPLDARSDLYSVGALSYFALTGHPPYERARPDDVLRAHVEAPVPAPSARRAAVPGAADRFVARAMAKNPARRFGSAGAMGAALTTILGTSEFLPAGRGARTAEALQPGPDTTVEQTVAADPDRTAVVGLGAAAAAAAAATSVDDQAELGRTRQLGAVPASELAAAEGVEETVEGAGGVPPEGPERSRWRAFFSSPTRITVLVLALVLVVAGVIWLWPDDDGAQPTVPVTHSPSPSPTQSATPSATPTRTQPTSGSTSRPTRTATPSATPSETPSATPSPTPSETPSEEPTPTQEPTPTEEPTEEPTDEPTPTDDPAEDPTEEPTDATTDEPTESPDPGAEESAPATPAGTTSGAAS